MRRRPIARGQQPRRKRPIARKTRISQRNRGRHARNWTRQYHSFERVLWVKSQRCATCQNRGGSPIHNSHVRSRGAGGGYADIIPQCSHCHAELHRLGLQSFARIFGFTVQVLHEIAAEIEAAWQRHTAKEAH